MLIERYAEQFGERTPIDMPFESSDDIASGDIIIPSDMDGVGPYPSTLRKVPIPSSLRSHSRFHHELAFSIAIQEALSSIIASDPDIDANITLGGLLSKGYTAAPVVIGGPFADTYRTEDGKDTGKLNFSCISFAVSSDITSLAFSRRDSRSPIPNNFPTKRCG